MKRLFLNVNQKISEYGIVLILMIGFLNGLVYVRIVPPWEHYDEPAHFEYSWLIAHRYKLPEPNDYDQKLRLAVGQSLIDSRFFERRGVPRPNLTDPNQPLWIGVSQIEDPPLYYILTAIPLSILRDLPVKWQLYSARIVSLFFLLITILAAYTLVCELTPPRHPLRWLVPLFIALLPGFVEFMTAVNDYPAAIGLAALWLLTAVRLIKKKRNLWQTLIFLALTVACYFTQKVLYYLIPLAPFILLLSFMPRGKEWMVGAATLITGAAVLGIIFNWNDAALWLRENVQDFPSRTIPGPQTGFRYALQAQVYPDASWDDGGSSWNPGFFQLIPQDDSEHLKGKQVTIAAWVWADQDMQGYGPGMNALYQFQDQWLGFAPVSLSTTPKFVASTVTIPQEVDRVQLWLRATSPDAPTGRIYFSGIVLTEGAVSTEIEPLMKETHSEGTWAGMSFKNLARNGQVNQAWPYLRPEVAHILTEKVEAVNPIVISSFIALFLDTPGTSWYLSGTLQRILQTFWAVFGWGQIWLQPLAWFPQPYFYLTIFTILGMISGLISIFIIFKPYRAEIVFLLFIFMATVIVVFFYGIYTMGGALRFRAYLPVARYIFPAIMPISLVLLSGWYGIAHFAAKSLRIPTQWTAVAGILLLVLLNGYSIYSIAQYARL